MATNEQSAVDVVKELEAEMEAEQTYSAECRRDAERAWRRAGIFMIISIVSGLSNVFLAVLSFYEAPESSETTPHATTTAEGYVAVGLLFPWPDASGYSEEQFVDDCDSVCTAPGPTRYGDGDGRVLVTDAEHLMCICFRPNRMNPVERWVNWARVP